MPHFFCPKKNITQGTIEVADKEQLHYLKDVLRVKAGCGLCFFDENSMEYIATVEEVSGARILLKIKTKRQADIAKKIRLTVACAIPKKAKMDDIVDKLTQLGVDKIIPLETERVIVRLDKKKAEARVLRWAKIARSAMQQCRALRLPEITAIKNLRQALEEAKDCDLKLIPTLTAGLKPLKGVLSEAKAKNILVLIGPEGDFTDEEVALAKKSGCVPVSLGDTVLRVDTAAIAVASFIRLNEDD